MLNDYSSKIVMSASAVKSLKLWWKLPRLCIWVSLPHTHTPTQTHTQTVGDRMNVNPSPWLSADFYWCHKIELVNFLCAIKRLRTLTVRVKPRPHQTTEDVCVCASYAPRFVLRASQKTSLIGPKSSAKNEPFFSAFCLAFFSSVFSFFYSLFLSI